MSTSIIFKIGEVQTFIIRPLHRNTSEYIDLWKKLDGPRYTEETNLMRTWLKVNGGYLSVFVTPGEKKCNFFLDFSF